MLRRVEPYIAWGYPSLKTVKELMYKRGYGKVDKSRIPLIDNSVIEQVRVVRDSIFAVPRCSCFTQGSRYSVSATLTVTKEAMVHVCTWDCCCFLEHLQETDLCQQEEAPWNAVQRPWVHTQPISLVLVQCDIFLVIYCLGGKESLLNLLLKVGLTPGEGCMRGASPMMFLDCPLLQAFQTLLSAFGSLC